MGAQYAPVVRVVFCKVNKLRNHLLQLLWLFQQFFCLIHNIRVNVCTAQISRQRGQIFVFEILIKVPMKVLQCLCHPVFLKGPCPVEHSLTGVSALVQQFPDSFSRLLPGNNGGGEALCAFPMGNPQAGFIIPEGIFALANIKSRAVLLVVFLQEPGVFFQWLVFHELRDNVQAAVRVVRAQGQGSVYYVLCHHGANGGGAFRGLPYHRNGGTGKLEQIGDIIIVLNRLLRYRHFQGELLHGLHRLRP